MIAVEKYSRNSQETKRFEYRFKDCVKNKLFGINDSVQYSHTLFRLWQFKAYMVIDHLNREIIKNVEDAK